MLYTKPSAPLQLVSLYGHVPFAVRWKSVQKKTKTSLLSHLSHSHA